MNSKITKNFWITLSLAACVLAVGGAIFRNSEAGSFVVLVVAFGGGLTLLHVLDDREERKHSGD